MKEFLLCNFIEITLLHGWYPVNLLRFCTTPFLNKTYGWLPLNIYTIIRNTVSCFLSLPTVIIHQFHSYTKILTIIPFIPTPQFPVFPPWIPAFITFPPSFLSSPPWSPHSHPDPPHSHPDSPRSQPYSPHFHSAWFTSFSPWFDAFPSFPSFRSLIPHSGLYR